jgi:hypothetical protein
LRPAAAGRQERAEAGNDRHHLRFSYYRGGAARKESGFPAVRSPPGRLLKKWNLFNNPLLKLLDLPLLFQETSFLRANLRNFDIQGSC